MKPDWHIRAADLDDLAGLSDIWLQLMQMHESADLAFMLAEDGLAQWQHMVRGLVDRDDTFVFVALKQTVPVGFCLGWIARNPPIYALRDVGFLSEIAVAQAFRQQGIGQGLIACARQWFARHKLLEFQLSTAVWNHTAQSFWARTGGMPMLLRYRFDVHPEPQSISKK